MRSPVFYGVFAALFGFSGVALGAFAAHGLKGVVSPARLEVFQTAVQYQMYHALVLLGVVILMQSKEGSASGISRWLHWSARALVFGVAVFCGSLYLLVMTDTGWLGAVTPIGGVAFLLGWLFLLFAFLERPDKNS